SDTRLPWHRVINAQGRISNPSHGLQATRLAEEGVILLKGRVDLNLFQWQP
ncbi:MAG: MGMT family protein, partial [Gammaproteobacteria bacterium]|nr:MGMT family protein [Gammaproteobacteria bacterium]